MKPSPPQPSLWTESWAAIRANALPGVALWAVAALVVLAYYGLEASRPWFDTVAGWKARGGFLYSMASTGLFAGVIPVVFLALGRSTRTQLRWSMVVFLVVFWTYRGFEIDAFYRFQGWLFGNTPTVTTVAAKVVCDIFVYNVVWAAHLQLLSYHWQSSGFRWTAFRGFPWRQYWTHRYPVALVSTWVVWIPVVSLTYSLPANLQIPVFNLAACFWSLVMATLTRRSPDHA